MAFDLTKVVPIYQSNIDQLINQMGKNVVLHFYDTITNVNSDFEDKVRPGGMRRPSFKETSISDAPTIVENTKIIKALIKHDAKNFDKELYPLSINSSNGIVRLKTFLTDVPDLLRCRFITTNADSTAVLQLDYRLLKEPIPVGLSQDRYAVSYWERT